MTPEQQRLALCEWAGWKIKILSNGFYYLADCTNEGVFKKEREGEYPYCVQGLPDTSSLDVLHEMEKKICDEASLGYRYDMTLGSVTGALEDGLPNYMRYWHATAAQRREALLRTLSLWKDTP